MARRAVFLDRDGILNKAVVRDGKPYPPSRPDDVELVDGIIESCNELKSAGFLLIVVTNQPDVARGTQTKETVEAINARLKAELPIDEFRICFHDDSQECNCRKPKPGLLIDAAGDLDIDINDSFLIGDRWKDIEAGNLAGCTTVFVDYEYMERKPSSPDCLVHSLREATKWILEHC